MPGLGRLGPHWRARPPALSPAANLAARSQYAGGTRGGSLNRRDAGGAPFRVDRRGRRELEKKKKVVIIIITIIIIIIIIITITNIYYYHYYH